MSLVVSGVTRFTVQGTLSDRPWANIVDMQIDTTGTGLSRADANFAAAGNIINSWVEHIMPTVVTIMSLDRVSWVDLDSADGDTGDRTSTSLHTLPVVGGRAQPASPNNTSVLVTKQTISARGQRNGRLYLPGIEEAVMTGTELASATVTDLNDRFNALLAEVNDEPIVPTNFDRSWVVVHTTGANPDTGTFTPVESMNVSERLATQRRRLRG